MSSQSRITNAEHQSRFEGKADKHCQRYSIRLFVIYGGSIEKRKQIHSIKAYSADVLELGVDTVMV